MKYYHDKFACYLVRTRKDIGSLVHQHFIARAAKDKRWMRCGCRSDIVLWLIPFEDPEGRFNFRRYRISDLHLIGCLSEPLEPVFESEKRSWTVIYTENMLLEDDGLTADFSFDTTAGLTSGNGSRYEGLVHFLQAQFTRASLETFSLANEGKAYGDASLLNPGQPMIFERLVELFNMPLLRQGSLSLETALGRMGLRLYWGVTDQPLVQESDRPLDEDEYLQFKIGSHWDCHGFQTKGVLLELSPEVLANSRGKAKAHRHVVPPPYLYAAVVKPTESINRVTHFYRVPACIWGGSIFLIESEAERRSLRIALAAGAALIKLHVQGNLRALGESLWPFRTDESGHLPSRPDIIAFLNGKVRIFYITDSRDDEYLKRVAESVAQLRLFLAHPDVLVLPRTAESFTDGSWLQLPA
jgi:hypothetical protein